MIHEDASPTHEEPTGLAGVAPGDGSQVREHVRARYAEAAAAVTGADSRTSLEVVETDQ